MLKPISWDAKKRYGALSGQIDNWKALKVISFVLISFSSFHSAVTLSPEEQRVVELMRKQETNRRDEQNLQVVRFEREDKDKHTSKTWELSASLINMGIIFIKIAEIPIILLENLSRFVSEIARHIQIIMSGFRSSMPNF
jgi:hypothetical protein